MNNAKIHALLAVAALCPSFFHFSANTTYTQQRDKQTAEHVKAMEKKQRVREQIRARRKGGAA